MPRRHALALAGLAAFAVIVANLPERRVTSHHLVRAADAAPVYAVHATTDADLAVMGGLPPVVGMRARWCRSQEACGR